MRRESCHYRIVWDRKRLGWSLTYDGQEWGFVSGFLPGQPPMDRAGAQQWFDQMLGHPQPWTPDRDGARAVPAP